MSEFDPQDPDVQEARSNVHAAGLRILALSSGRFAIFGRGIQLRGIHETLREEILREYCEEEMKDWEASVQAEVERRGPSHPPPSPNAKAPEDMGL